MSKERNRPHFSEQFPEGLWNFITRNRKALALILTLGGAGFYVVLGAEDSAHVPQPPSAAVASTARSFTGASSPDAAELPKKPPRRPFKAMPPKKFVPPSSVPSSVGAGDDSSGEEFSVEEQETILLAEESGEDMEDIEPWVQFFADPVRELQTPEQVTEHLHSTGLSDEFISKIAPLLSAINQEWIKFHANYFSNEENNLFDQKRMNDLKRQYEAATREFTLSQEQQIALRLVEAKFGIDMIAVIGL